MPSGTIVLSFAFNSNGDIFAGTTDGVFKSGTPIAVPDAPTLVSPTNSAIEVSTSPTLRWNKAARAATYTYQLSPNPDPRINTLRQGTTSDTFQVITGLSPATGYYWRVWSSNAAGNSQFSSFVWNFTTVAQSSNYFYVLLSPSNTGPSAIVLFDVDGQGKLIQRTIYETGGLSSTSSTSQSVLADPINKFLFAGDNESGHISVFKVLSDGQLSKVSGSPFLAGSNPSDMAIHPSGKYLYASAGTNAIRVYDVTSTGAIIPKQVVSSAIFPREMKVHPNGTYLYVADMARGVREYSISNTGTLSELIGSPFTYNPFGRPTDLILNSTGDKLFLLDLDNGVVVFTINTSGIPSIINGSPFQVASFTNEFGLTHDGNYLYVNEPFSNRLHGYRVGTSGLPFLVKLPTSPFVSGGVVSELLNPSGTALLYEVTQGNRINISQIDNSGTIRATSFSPITVNDNSKRVANAATFFKSVTTGVHSEQRENLPNSFALFQNYPNPFNPVTTIEFSLPRSSLVKLKVYSCFGEEIATLVSENLPSGNHKVQWNAKGMASGVYFYRLYMEDLVQTQKLLLVK